MIGSLRDNLYRLYDHDLSSFRQVLVNSNMNPYNSHTDQYTLHDVDKSKNLFFIISVKNKQIIKRSYKTIKIDDKSVLTEIQYLKDSFGSEIKEGDVVSVLDYAKYGDFSMSPAIINKCYINDMCLVTIFSKTAIHNKKIRADRILKTPDKEQLAIIKLKV